MGYESILNYPLITNETSFEDIALLGYIRHNLQSVILNNPSNMCVCVLKAGIAAGSARVNTDKNSNERAARRAR